MFQGSTDFLSYVLVMFLLWVYLPYILFRLCAERKVDLGRSNDETWFEEMIGAFLPGFVLNAHAIAVYRLLGHFWPGIFNVDMAVMASMFGQNRGAISDYIYSGNLAYCFIYVGFLWFFAILYGSWFGWSAAKICATDAALEGVEYIAQPQGWREVKKELFRKRNRFRGSLKRIRTMQAGPDRETFQRRLTRVRRRHLWKASEPYRILLGWWIWFRFFRESIVPLYTWREWRCEGVYVRVETKKGAVYCGTLVGYEKKSGGEIDAIRLKDALMTVDDSGNAYVFKAFYLNWREVSQMGVITSNAPPRTKKQTQALLLNNRPVHAEYGETGLLEIKNPQARPREPRIE